MPTTANYGWTTPTPGGSNGAWGTLLNTVFTEIDADLKAVSDAVASGGASSAQTPILGVEVVGIPHTAMLNVNDAFQLRHDQGGILVCQTDTSTATWVGHYVLRDLSPGQTLTGFTSTAFAFSMASATMKLGYYDIAGDFTQLGATQNLPVGVIFGAVTVSGLTHEVEEDRTYVVKLEFIGQGVGSPAVDVVSVQATVS